MGNHNILITNPRGERRLEFKQDTTLEVCRQWIKMYVPPKGWMFQIVNNKKTIRKYPIYVLVRGYDKEGALVDIRKANVKLNGNYWYTLRMAKKDSRSKGSIRVISEKVWEE